MAGTGEKKAYYRMKTEQHFDEEKFVKWMTRYGGIGRELIALRRDPASGITTKGHGTAKVYVKAKEPPSSPSV